MKEMRDMKNQDSKSVILSLSKDRFGFRTED